MPGSKASKLKKLVRRAARALNIPPSDITEIRLLKRSVDARKKHDVHFVATLAIELTGGAKAEAAAIEAAALRKGAANVKAHRPYEPLQVLRKSALRARRRTNPAPSWWAPARPACFARSTWRAPVCARLWSSAAAVDERMAAVDAFNAGEPPIRTPISSTAKAGRNVLGWQADHEHQSPWAQHVLHLFVEAARPRRSCGRQNPTSAPTCS